MIKTLTATTIAAVALSIGISHAADDEEGFVKIFDGKTLKNWDGNPEFWSVEDGAITGTTTKEKPTKGNTFCIWRGGELGDFELRMKFRIGDKGNSGVQFRSKEVANKKWVISGYQADFDAAGGWTGTLYEEKGRGILAKRGNEVVIEADGKKKSVGKTAEEKEIVAAIKKGDEWNDYTIIAEGNKIVQKLNGVVTVKVVDHQEEKRAMTGLLALQLHAGPPMKVQFKDIRVKQEKKK